MLAGFLCWTTFMSRGFFIPYELRKSSQTNVFGIDELKFHSSFDWVMLVVDKIENTLYDATKVRDVMFRNYVYDANITELFGRIEVETVTKNGKNFWYYNLCLANETHKTMIVNTRKEQLFESRISCYFNAVTRFIELSKTNFSIINNDEQ